MLITLRKGDVIGDKGENTISGDSILTTWKFDQERCRHMLARMIIIDQQSFSIVEHFGFHDFVTKLQPFFQHLSRFTVARDCMKLYLNEKNLFESFFW